MCGFLGFVGHSISESEIRKLLLGAQYRGPDHTGVAGSDEWILGHNRLSIIDLDARSHQPFTSENGRYTIVYNGEIYNYKVLREDLLKVGYTFRTQSDTEVIINAFAEWGVDCFIRFHGMFALAIIDRVEQTVTLARDRFGEKPVFYSGYGGGLVFSSELRTIAQFLTNLRLDLEAVIDYLHFGFIPAPKTIYRSVFKVEPGCVMSYSLKERKVTSNRPYYKLRLTAVPDRTMKQLREQFTEICARVATQISLSDVPLGAFLSGGVDSSGVVYFLSGQDRSITTYTAGFEGSAFDETKYAEEVANHLKVRNVSKTVLLSDFVRLYDTMVDHYAEPHNDFSFIPTYAICREAVKNFKVMISGDGADELFCGYPRFHKLRQYELFNAIPGASYILSKSVRALPSHSNIRRQLSYAGATGSDFFLHTMSVNFQPAECHSILGPDLVQVSNHYSPKSVIEGHLTNVPKALPLIQKQRYLDIKMTLADDMLVKVDRASMANSLEVRPFYLHPLVSDFAFSLPQGQLASLTTDKVFLKNVIREVLPRTTIHRRKMGFTFPFREYIKGPLQAHFRESIESLPEGLIRKEAILPIMSKHFRGSRDYTHQLHSLMFLGRFLRKYSY